MGSEARRRNRSASFSCALRETRTELGARRATFSGSHRSRESGCRSFPDGLVRGRDHQGSAARQMKTPTHYFAATCSRTEELLNQCVAPDSKMRRHIRKNSGERADFNRVVIRNSQMMLATFFRAQPQVAACLPRCSITQDAQCLGKI